MAEPRYSSSDIPEFSSYPGSSGRYIADAVRNASGEKSKGVYDEPARRIGSAVGRMVNTVRTQQGLARDAGNDLAERASDTASVVADTVRDRTQRVVQQARQKANAATSAAKDTVHNLAGEFADRVAPNAPGSTPQERLSNEAQRVIDDSRRRLRRLPHDYPVQVIGAMAVFGLGCGILLRAWREK